MSADDADDDLVVLMMMMLVGDADTDTDADEADHFDDDHDGGQDERIMMVHAADDPWRVFRNVYFPGGKVGCRRAGIAAS